MQSAETVTAGYLPFLERVLTPKRLAHSLGVMQVMGELAPIYGLDMEQAQAAGLLHDAAKDLPPGEIATLAREFGLSTRWPWDGDYSAYTHGPVGAAFLRRERITGDPLILGAVAMHTFMPCPFAGATLSLESPFAWCLRFADLLEPNRNWDERAHWIRDGGPRLRALVYGGHLAEAAFLQSGLVMRFFAEMGIPIHPNICAIYHARMAEIGASERWFEFA